MRSAPFVRDFEEATRAPAGREPHTTRTRINARVGNVARRARDRASRPREQGRTALGAAGEPQAECLRTDGSTVSPVTGSRTAEPAQQARDLGFHQHSDSCRKSPAHTAQPRARSVRRIRSAAAGAARGELPNPGVDRCRGPRTSTCPLDQPYAPNRPAPAPPGPREFAETFTRISSSDRFPEAQRPHNEVRPPASAPGTSPLRSDRARSRRIRRRRVNDRPATPPVVFTRASYSIDNGPTRGGSIHVPAGMTVPRRAVQTW